MRKISNTFLIARVFISVTVIWCVSWLVFKTIGHYIIARAYDKSLPFEFLNNIIEGQYAYDVQKYLNYADDIFTTWSIRFFAIGVPVILLIFLAGKKRIVNIVLAVFFLTVYSVCCFLLVGVFPEPATHYQTS